MGDAPPAEPIVDETPAEGGALDDLAAMAKESAAFALELARPTLEAIQKDPTQAAPWVAGLLVCMRQRGFNRVVLLGTVAAAWTSLENVELIEGVAPEHVRLAVVALLALLPALGRRKGHPERLGAAGAVRSPHHAAHRRRLVAFYEKNAPEKVNDVDAILAKYLGREDALFARLDADADVLQPYADATADLLVRWATDPRVVELADRATEALWCEEGALRQREHDEFYTTP